MVSGKMEEPPEIEQWRRISVLGSGAFGIVSLWQNIATSEYIAIKKCKFRTTTHLTDRQKRRWENEVSIMKTLSCINIVSFKELPKHLEAVLVKYNPSRLPLLSMEYCTKGNLRHVLNQARNSTGLPEREVRKVLTDITSAVSYLHKFKITHRDIKPENIVLQETDTEGGVIYKLIDLGYAKELTDSVVSFVGTLHYLAPEIMQTECYNHTVDYWSLGTVAFEIICGVLPFLPQFTPVQRFPYIIKKKKEHICIYQMQSGSIAYSTELLKQHHISTCLQQNVEVWLRHVLQFDPTKRGCPLSDNSNVFDYLLNVLRKNVINVFSVHTLEFYSYEIDESTLISTLKEWIWRDTKVQKDDQVLLSCKLASVDDDKFVQDVISNTDLYVYKKGAFTSRDFKLPKYVTQLFENCTKQYKWRELRPIYAKSLYFLTRERQVLASLVTAFNLYNGHIDSITETLKNGMKNVHKCVSSALIRIECYCNLHSSNIHNTIINEEYKNCLKRLQKLLNDFESCVTATNKLLTKVAVLSNRQRVLKQILPKIAAVVGRCEFDVHVEKATELIARGANEEGATPRDMVKIISKALKDREGLMNNNNFQSYAKAVSVGVRDVVMVQKWMNGFNNRVAELTKAIDDNQREQYGILLSSVQAPPELSHSNHCAHLDAVFVINQNRELRCELEDALGRMFADKKKFHEEIEFYSSQKF